MSTQAVAADLAARELGVRPELGDLRRVRSFAELAAQDFGLCSAATYDFKLAASEAVANAIEHGLPCRDGLIHVWVSIGSERLGFGVRDCGEFAMRASTPGELAERGRGLATIAILMDELTVRCRGGETVVEFAKRRTTDRHP
jgi:anti-sigma regulatory factor (Ser/Thr protein kinase)